MHVKLKEPVVSSADLALSSAVSWHVECAIQYLFHRSIASSSTASMPTAALSNALSSMRKHKRRRKVFYRHHASHFEVTFLRSSKSS